MNPIKRQLAAASARVAELEPLAARLGGSEARAAAAESEVAALKERLGRADAQASGGRRVYVRGPWTKDAESPRPPAFNFDACLLARAK